MFTSLTSNFDFILKIVALALFLLSLTYVGFGFSFRIIFIMFRVRFSSSKLSEVDKKLLDLQLIRLCHGVTLEKISDIEIYSEAIESGSVQAPRGWLLPSYQALGQHRIGKKENIFVSLAVLALIIFVISFVVSTTKDQKYNYAEFSNSDNEHVLVSEIYVYDPAKKNYYNKSRCTNLPSTSKEILRTACGYMLTNDPGEKKELQYAIRNSNKGLRVIGCFCMAILLVVFIILFSYPRFYKFNNEFYDYKNRG